MGRKNGASAHKRCSVLHNKALDEWVRNNYRHDPPPDESPMTCRELAAIFLKHIEEEHTGLTKFELTKAICKEKTALTLFARRFGDKPVNEFRPLDLVSLQKSWEVEGNPRNGKGYARKSINLFTSAIKRAFDYGVVFYGIEAPVLWALQSVKGLRRGKTKAPEHRRIPPVPMDVVERTLPHLAKTYQDMVMVQYLSGMRPQDVCNLRLISALCFFQNMV